MLEVGEGLGKPRKSIATVNSGCQGPTTGGHPGAIGTATMGGAE